MNKKFFVIALVVSLSILLLVLLLSPKSSQPPPTPSLPPSGTSQLRSELSSLADDKKKAAVAYVSLVKDRLPIYYEGFETSVGIDTTINIFRLDGDPEEITRLEIYGLSYLYKDELDEQKNPNVTAFKESFNKALSILQESGIDPKQLVFVYGDKDYVRITSTYWVDKLGLLR